MSTSLQNKRILVTGAAAGIGFGIARACADAGAALVVTDINEKGLVDVAKTISGDVQSVRLDVSDKAEMRRFFAEFEGRLDGVVNNAGVTIEGDFLEFADDDLERLWTTDLRSVFYMCQQAGKLMTKQGGGSIVNVSSVHALASTPGFEMYAGVKGGITSMTRAMCWSLGSHGIRVNTLSPGLTHTEEVARVIEAQPRLAESFKAMHASGRYASVEEIAAIAVFLLSDNSAAITGADIVADHGQSVLLARSEDLV